MIIIFILLIIGIVISIIVWKYETKIIENPNGWKKSRFDSWATIITCSISIFLIYSLAVYSSYDTYLDDRAFFSATSEQYHSAINIYKDHAVIDMGQAAFTDLKYQGYQDNISSFISSLRNRIISYNESIIIKRTMGKNPFFSWFVIEPDKDMVIMKMKIGEIK